jgi:hypothetical protein
MPFTAFWYGKAFANILGGETAPESSRIDFLSDDMRIMLMTSSYTPNIDTHEFQSDITNEVVGTGYTTGGLALSSKTITYTPANSWGTARANGTPYNLGDIVRPAAGNGHLYRCVVAGTSAGAPPTFTTTSGLDVVDGGVTWTECGTGILQIDAADAVWSSSTITARYAAIYDNTPGSAATNPLMGYLDFGGNITSTNGSFTVQFATLGLFVFLMN